MILQTLKLNTDVCDEGTRDRPKREPVVGPKEKKVMVTSETQTSPPTPRKHNHYRHRHSSKEDRGVVAGPRQPRANQVPSGSRTSLENVGRAGKDMTGSKLLPPGFMMGAVPVPVPVPGSGSRDTGTVTSSVSLESPSTSSHSSPTHRYRPGNGSGGPPSRDGSMT